MSAQNNPHKHFAWQVRVYYEDTDLAGLVYHANYLKFFERARSEWLRWLGHQQTDLKARDNLVFVIRRLEIDYLKVARLDDLIDISVALTPSKHHVYHLIDQEARVAGELIARARVKLACLEADTLKPRVIPDLRPKLSA